MRLIDADNLIQEFKGRCICDCDRCKWQKPAYCGLIDNAPTVEQRPHGKWIRTEHDKKGEHPETARWYKCSVCNVYNRVNLIFKYCPECGAQMDITGGNV